MGLSAQKKKIELLGADELEGVTYKNQKANLLNGNVRVLHEGSLVKCNKGYLFIKSNDMEAFGRVSIQQPDGTMIFGDSLFYSGDTRIAKFRGNVRVVDDGLTVTTNHLDYDTKEETAWYYGGGKIVDDGMNLTSKTAFFDSKQDFYSFKGDVKVLKGLNRIEADTMKYAAGSKKAYFFGPSNIYTPDNHLYAENGIYDTHKDEAWFSDRAWMETDDSKIYGDSLYFNNETNYGYAIQNVVIESYNENAIIYGDVAINDGARQLFKVFGNALLIDRSDGDTTYIAADTLVSIEDTTLKKKNIFAQKDVKIIKGEMSGICDSLIYNSADSTVSLYKNPILWNTSTQIIGDSIITLLANDKVDQMKVYQNSFISSQSTDDSTQFDQIEGRDIVAFFREGKLAQMNVNGNGKSIYYAYDEDKAWMGLNTVICSEMKMFLKEDKMDNIRFYGRPIASFTPPQMVNETNKVLPNFEWRASEKPRLSELIQQAERANKTVDLENLSKALKLPTPVVEEVDQTEELSNKEKRKRRREERKSQKD